jgi:1,4-alpha-glucan branching enzyme
MTSVTGDGCVEFRFYRPQASRVCVVGEFNSWIDGVLRMIPEGNGWWSASTRLSPGDYRFRYVADGVWYTDYASHGIEAGPNGWNAILVVSEPVRITSADTEDEDEFMFARTSA